MAAKKDEAQKILDAIRGSKMTKVKSIEIEFEDPEEEDMKSKIEDGIKKARKLSLIHI